MDVSVSLNKAHPLVEFLGESPVPLMEETVRQCVARDIPFFLSAIMSPDHVCWRCSSDFEYVKIRDFILKGCGEVSGRGEPLGKTLIEAMIGGRPISTFQLQEPIQFKVTSSAKVVNYEVSLLEIPSVKSGRSYVSGWEHFEFCFQTLDRGLVSPKSQLDMENELAEVDRIFNEFVMARDTYPRKPEVDIEGRDVDLDYPKWILNLDTHRNADIAFGFQIPCWANRSVVVKFHAYSLQTVIQLEIKAGDVDPSPVGYFEQDVVAEREKPSDEKPTVEPLVVPVAVT